VVPFSPHWCISPLLLSLLALWSLRSWSYYSRKNDIILWGDITLTRDLNPPMAPLINRNISRINRLIVDRLAIMINKLY
jgi:hypothetical protein